MRQLQVQEQGVGLYVRGWGADGQGQAERIADVADIVAARPAAGSSEDSESAPAKWRRQTGG
jgi:hypothetical protein